MSTMRVREVRFGAPFVFRVEPDTGRHRARHNQTVLEVLSEDPQATIRELA